MSTAVSRSRKGRRIILASGSRARRKLLRQIGLSFSVARSRVREDMAPKAGRPDFVIGNALKKARDVAKRRSSGIVIGADTVVAMGKKTVGKPRSLKSAADALKALSAGPQWVYTGIAVIDIDNQKTYTDYEKTKVYMYRLSERQIRSYLLRISPFDKAGSFDVQGPGSVFIDRIEGCFYNVVGLPLAKLARILKKAGVDLFG